MKRLKYFFMALVMVTGLLGTSFSSSAEASSYSTGKAVISGYSTNDHVAAYYYISNITDNPINVTITFYNTDGTLVVDDNNPSTGRITSLSPQILNYHDQNVDSSLTFTLNAHCTGLIALPYTSTVQVGYGVIQWTQNGNQLQGLTAWGQVISNRTDINSESRSTLTINGGLPF